MGYAKSHAATILGLFIFTAALLSTVESLSIAVPRYDARAEFLLAHNALRAAVGVGPMTWNRTLAAYARSYAARRAAGGCELEHSGGPYGENLSEGSGYVTAADAVRYWATEKPHYDYATNKCVGEECRHYTQIVWRDSVRLGCARAKCNNGWMFVICNYDPPGNYEGERPY